MALSVILTTGGLTLAAAFAAAEQGLNVDSPAVLVPVGVVMTSMVTILGLFLRASARVEKRSDAVSALRVEAAEAERDRAIQDLDECEQKRQEDQIWYRAYVEDRVRQEQERWKTTVEFQYGRIRDLEMLLYREIKTPPPPTMLPKPTTPPSTPSNSESELSDD